MKLTILGSGTSVPSHRMAPAYLVQAPGVTLLLDCGSGCTHSLARREVGLHTLTGILLTHLHLDHTGDLAPLLFALANPLHPRRGADLPVWGPEGTAAFLAQLRGLYGRWVEPREAEVRPRDLQGGDTLSLGPLTIRAYAVEHSGHCLAYRVAGQGGGGICVSGDTGPCDGLTAAARGAELLVCECAVLEHEQPEGHMRASDVGRTAAAAGCRRVVLTHLYPHVVRSRPVETVRQHFDGEVELAEDGLELPVPG